MQPSQNYIPDEISIYLENALNPDLNIRKQAEDKITQLYQQDFGKFLFLLSEKLPNEQEKKQVRQMGATLIKNLIIKEEYTDKYLNLSEQSKTEIKKNILSTLASGDVDIRKAAALTVAGICRVEIPKKQWLDIFELLLSTSQNENMNIQLSSLTCLEYIYEEIKPSDLSSEIIVKLLNTYYSLLTKENLNEELCYNTLKSVLKFLPFIREIIKDYENQIGFYNLIEKFIRNKNKIKEQNSKKNNSLPSTIFHSLTESTNKHKNNNNNVIIDYMTPYTTRVSLKKRNENIINDFIKDNSLNLMHSSLLNRTNEDKTLYNNY